MGLLIIVVFLFFFNFRSPAVLRNTVSSVGVSPRPIHICITRRSRVDYRLATLIPAPRAIGHEARQANNFEGSGRAAAFNVQDKLTDMHGLRELCTSQSKRFWGEVFSFLFSWTCWPSGMTIGDGDVPNVCLHENFSPIAPHLLSLISPVLHDFDQISSFLIAVSQIKKSCWASKQLKVHEVGYTRQLEPTLFHNCLLINPDSFKIYLQSHTRSACIRCDLLIWISISPFCPAAGFRDFSFCLVI